MRTGSRGIAGSLLQQISTIQPSVAGCLKAPNHWQGHDEMWLGLRTRHASRDTSLGVGRVGHGLLVGKLAPSL